jgi:SAM-dependent methyltransferase
MYDQRWSAEWIEREFEAGYKDYIFDRILRELDRRRPARPRRLLDVGAHVGRFMATAKQSGWTVEGIELNPATAACAARRTGAIVHQVNAHALSSKPGQYDAVTLTDVLEHIPEPVTLLESAARLLKPGGWIAVKVPCGRSQWQKERVLSALKPGRRVSLADNLVHINHFTPGSLEAALTRAGFSHVALKTGAPELTAPAGLRGRLSNAVRMSLFAAASVPGGVHTPLAFNLQAYAMKADAA